MPPLLNFNVNIYGSGPQREDLAHGAQTERWEEVKTDSAVVQKVVTQRMFLEITGGCPGLHERGGLIRPNPDHHI